ncbi:hypothetical protein AMAG_08866 [Allomyces macrogynus ATCC 38327]|uniref:Peptidase S8/S53 domain-containing protein n=1 Tax=Allomyces macrogynus (strain ATCC 38327) TaxID=578462 RepID=A0A0L0SN43_ALLM3|nr:hypothetical protein AMAG_08866 [Allomyces macrogynus ATCC 38327]|eukprot:KNE63789.1 hypothetical protein AMAG_08866 [Allomyces macrogynus ATCC 38327]
METPSARRGRVPRVLALPLLLTLVSIATAATIHRLPPRSLPRNTGIATRRYIIEFQASPALLDAPGDTVSPSAALAQHASFTSFLAQSGLDEGVAVQRTFVHVFNGAAVEVASDEMVEALAVAPNVKAVFPVVTYRLDPQEMAVARKGASPQLVYANNLTRVAQVHTDLGVTGKGVKVGVVDTGIDYLHPAFWVPGKQCTQWKGDGCRVVDGKDFVGDAYNANDPASRPAPSASPMDCNSHGTHVAGIIGGKDSLITGVAPDVTFYAARIFGCSGTTATDIILDAIEHAYLAGCNVINLSIGQGSTFASYPDARAIDKLAVHGLLAAASQGNAGKLGMFQAQSPAAARNALAVASIDNTFVNLPSMLVNGVEGIDPIPYILDTGVKTPWPKTVPLAIKLSPLASADACTTLLPNALKNTVALLRRGPCTFLAQATTALAAGAKGVLFYNDQFGPILEVNLGVPEFSAPVAYLTGYHGMILAQALASSPTATITITDTLVPVMNPTGGQLSDFSGWGPGAQLELKPDLSAPGGFILSSVPLRMGAYTYMSGTSMASPMLAGAMALYVERHGRRKTKFDAVRTAFLNTAIPIAIPGSASPWPVYKQGAGLVDVLAALTTTVSITPAKIELGASRAPGDVKRARLTVTNTGRAPVMYTVQHVQAPSVLGEGGVTQDALQYSDQGARVLFSTTSIRIPAGGSASLALTVDAYAASFPVVGGHWMLSGHVVLSSTTAPTLRVPYILMRGAYETYPQLPPHSAFGAPLISTAALAKWDLTGAMPNDVPVWTNGTTAAFSLRGDDKPVLLADCALVTRAAVVALIDARSGVKLGYLPHAVEFLATGPWIMPEPGAVTGKPGYGWDGTYVSTVKAALGRGKGGKVKTVPDGEYVWQLELTRPSSARDDGDEFMELFRPVWKSPVIVVKRAGANSTRTATSAGSTSLSDLTSTRRATPPASSTTALGSLTATGTRTVSDQIKTASSDTATGTISATTTDSATATTTQSPGTTVIPCPPCPGGTKTVIIVQPTATVTTTVYPCPVCPGGTKTVIIVPPTATVTQTVTPQPTMTTVPCNVCPGGIKTVIIIPPVGTQTDVCTIEPTHTVVPCKDANTCPPSGSTTQVIVQPTVPASPTTAGPAPTVTTEPCGKCPGGVKTIIIVPPTGTQTAPATVTPTNTVVPCNECSGGVKTVIVIPPPAQPTTVTSTVTVPESPIETKPVPVATTPAPVPVATQPAGDSYGELEVPQ